MEKKAPKPQKALKLVQQSSFFLSSLLLLLLAIFLVWQQLRRTQHTAELQHSSHTACQVPSCMESLSKGAEPHPASSSAATRSLPANKMLPTSSQRGTKPCHSGWHTRDPRVLLPEEALQWQRLPWRLSLLFTGEAAC